LQSNKAEASTGIVEVATASAGVKRIQGSKKTRTQAIKYAEATYLIQTVKDDS